ncbi:tetratricopeptide repeat protein [Longispora albida]|uniref:tetratricopeptide repeat protein n=1 Tax=Longispora albida TaxID=203523 RepID=UPI00039CB9C5|nr:hypothetical protein [Longispora albida]
MRWFGRARRRPSGPLRATWRWWLGLGLVLAAVLVGLAWWFGRDFFERLNVASQVAGVTGTLLALVSLMATLGAWLHPKQAPGEADGQVRGRLIPVGRLRGEDVGVHSPDHLLHGRRGDDPVGYFSRGFDSELRQCLEATRSTGGLIQIVGPSSSGKSRSLVEAVRETLPGWQVYLPDGLRALRSAVPVLAPRTVVWLDDTPTPRYFVETTRSEAEEQKGSLSRAELEQLTRSSSGPIVVVVVFWPEHYRRCLKTPAQTPEGHPGADLLAVAREALLSHGTVIEVPAALSPAERAAAEVVGQRDPRVGAALADRQYGVTQYLAGAPEVMRRYETASPYTRALADVVISAALLAGQPYLSLSRLKRAAELDLANSCLDGETTVLTEAPPDWFETALTDATERRTGGTALLRKVSGARLQVGDVEGFCVADFLLQSCQLRPHDRTADGAWLTLAHSVDSVSEAHRLGIDALSRSLFVYAEPLLRYAHDNGHPDAGHELGWLLAEQGRREDLAELINEGAAGARWGLAKLLADQGDTLKALSLYRELAAEGSLHAGRAVPRLLVKCGLPAEAIVEYGRSADRGDLVSRKELADLHAARGSFPEAMAVYMHLRRMGSDMGVMEEARCVGQHGGCEAILEFLGATAASPRAAVMVVLESRADPELMRELAEADVSEALRWRLDYLISQGQISEASAVVKRLLELGNLVETATIARLLEKDGDVEWLRKFVDAGEVDARPPLVRLLRALGRQEEADQVLEDTEHFDTYDPFTRVAVQNTEARIRKMIADGKPGAASHLISLYRRHGKVDELRKLSDEGMRDATSALVSLLVEAGEMAEVRVLADAGEFFAVTALVEAAMEAGDLTEAADLLRAIPAGRGGTRGEAVQSALALKFDRAGRPDMAVVLLRDLYDHGAHRVTRNLAEVLAKTGNFDEVLDLYEPLVRKGDLGAQRIVLELLYQAGRHDEAWDVARRSPLAGRQFITILGQHGEAEHLQSLVAMGDSRAARELVGLFAREGREADLRAMVISGDSDARIELLAYLHRTGRVEEAQLVEQYGLFANGTTRQPELREASRRKPSLEIGDGMAGGRAALTAPSSPPVHASAESVTRQETPGGGR